MGEVRRLVASDPALSKNYALLRSISGIGEVSAVVLLAELPNIADFSPKALAAFAGLSPSEHSSGSSVRRPGKISRVSSRRLRGLLYMCAQRQAGQQSPGRLRPAYGRSGQAAQGHPGRRRPQAPGLRACCHPHPKAVPTFPGCPFFNLTASKTP